MNNIILAALPILAALETRGIAAIAAAVAISCGAFASTYAMGKATSSALEAGARQPEIISKLQTMLLIAIVFMESIGIYALVVAFLLIFTVQ
ncbi:MAG: ATP synthase F0 subunit C [Clostridiales bacterium]|jgi:F-type H+-transporting ATPase subunit c|nr:ATP synthase F0 subunit C [Clostridiales bacterium]